MVSYIYDDWGETSINGDTSFYNQICYTGGVYDELTNLYYLNARYYNPYTGTFMSQDTVRGSASDYGSWNLYAYCAGNPVCYVDPSGHWVETVIDGWCFVDSANEAIKDPSPENIGWAVWDGVALFVPCVTGSYTAKAGKKVVKAVAKKTTKKAKKEISEKVVKKKVVNKTAKKINKNTRKSVDDLIKGLKETTNGKGVARNFDSLGGYKKTLKDFKSLKLNNVKNITTKYGTGKVGILSDGTKVIARPGSTTGGATLEIRISNKKVYKIRY